MGESNLLEKITAETQLMELKNQLEILESEKAIFQTKIQALIQSEEKIEVNTSSLSTDKNNFEQENVENNPRLAYLKQQIAVQENMVKVEKSEVMPDLTLGYFNQSMIGEQYVGGVATYFDQVDRFSGFQVSLGIPIFTKSNRRVRF